MPPFMPMRFMGRLSKSFIKMDTDRKMHKLSREEKDAMLALLCQIFLRKGSAENAIHVMFKYNFIPVHPLIGKSL